MPRSEPSLSGRTVLTWGGAGLLLLALGLAWETPLLALPGAMLALLVTVLWVSRGALHRDNADGGSAPHDWGGDGDGGD